MVEEKKSNGDTLETQFKDRFQFLIKNTKSSLRIMASNEITKYKYVFAVSLQELKKSGIKKSVKGVYRLLYNGLSKNDSHIKVSMFFASPKDGNTDEYDPTIACQSVEDFEVPDKDTPSKGDKMYIYLCYTSDYDETSEFLFGFNEVVEDDAARLRHMARDRKLETEDLKKRVGKLEEQVNFKTTLEYFLSLRIKALREFIRSTKDMDRKLMKKVKDKMSDIEIELGFLKPGPNKKEAMKQFELVRRQLLQKKDQLPSGFDDTILLEDEWQDILMEFCGEEKEGFNLIYRASRDGKSASAFHQKCNGKSNTYTIIKSTRGYVFGGYNPHAWASSNTYAQISPKAFLFSLKNASGKKPLKLINQGQYKQYGAYNGSSYGPTFGGGHDLYIASNLTSNSNYSNLGYSYTMPGMSYGQQNCKNFLAGSYNFQVTDIEVFALAKD